MVVVGYSKSNAFYLILWKLQSMQASMIAPLDRANLQLKYTIFVHTNHQWLFSDEQDPSV